MISRRSALRVLAIAPAAAAMSVAGQAAPSEAAAPAELPEYESVFVCCVSPGQPWAEFDGQILWGNGGLILWSGKRFPPDEGWRFAALGHDNGTTIRAIRDRR